MVIELFLFIIGQNMIILAFNILSFAIILYPILFFLERFIDFIKHIGKRVIHFFCWLIDGIIRLYFAVVNWIEKLIRTHKVSAITDGTNRSYWYISYYF